MYLPPRATSAAPGHRPGRWAAAPPSSFADSWFGHGASEFRHRPLAAVKICCRSCNAVLLLPLCDIAVYRCSYHSDFKEHDDEEKLYQDGGLSNSSKIATT
ncbi:hypothetical protein ACH5RR_006619 [Cinchona calisaya]|uniref:Uncharacterized protein n=1 Tax=Cinchona calisaya TaxID=153742 RepID=A0ABD3APJ2_9GENT